MAEKVRMVISMTPEQKARIQATARQHGISASEFVRRAFEAYELMLVLQKLAEIETLIADLNESTRQSNAALEETLRKLAEKRANFAAMRANPCA